MKRPRIPEVQVWQVFDARIRIRNSEFQSPSPFFICVLSVLLLELIKLRPRRVGRWTRGGMELGAPSLSEKTFPIPRHTSYAPHRPRASAGLPRMHF